MRGTNNRVLNSVFSYRFVIVFYSALSLGLLFCLCLWGCVFVFVVFVCSVFLRGTNFFVFAFL